VFHRSSGEEYELLERDIDDSLSVLMYFRERRKDHITSSQPWQNWLDSPPYANMRG
jgi:hypothetical protein